jgi:hypothetical protein
VCSYDLAARSSTTEPTTLARTYGFLSATAISDRISGGTVMSNLNELFATELNEYGGDR